jgi:hypothetical protein
MSHRSSASRNIKWAKQEDIIPHYERGVLLLGNDDDTVESYGCFNNICFNNKQALLCRWWKDTQGEASKPQYLNSYCEPPGRQAVIDTSRGSFTIHIGVVPEVATKYDSVGRTSGRTCVQSFAGFCAIVVFSGASRLSLEDVESKWIPLLKHSFEEVFLPCPPFVLLATDSGSDDWVVDRDEATSVATRIGAVGNRVFECTLENGDDVLQAAFEAVVVAGLEKRWAQRLAQQRLAQRGRRCNIQ